MVAKRRWTPAEDAVVILASWSPGSWRRTAAKLGRTVNAVTARAAQLRREGAPGIGRKSRGNHAPRWSSEEKAKLEQLVVAGASTKAASAELGRSMTAVRQQLLAKRPQGPRRPPLTRVERELVVELARAGEATEAIAVRVHRSISAVQKLLGKLAPDAIRSPRPFTEADDARIREGIRAKESVPSIARALGRHVMSVRGRAERLGCPPMRVRLIRRWTTTEIKRAIELRKQGLTMRSIGEALGRSDDEVSRVLRAQAKRFARVD